MKTLTRAGLTLATVGLATAALTLSPSQAAATKAPRVMPLTVPVTADLQNPRALRAHGRVLEAQIEVGYSMQIINGQPVYLRTYDGSLVGPTLWLEPGDELKLRLVNNLPDNPDNPLPPDPNVTPGPDPSADFGATAAVVATGEQADANTAASNFNTTNLHYHGLHVSPGENSDNVLLKIEPGDYESYSVSIPSDHPPGTHWYHSHVHGSTSVQTASGMSGMIIIGGGLDTNDKIERMEDRQFVLAQPAYSQCGPKILSKDTAPTTGAYCKGVNNPTWYYETCDDFYKRTLGTKAPAQRVGKDGKALPTACVENFVEDFGSKTFATLGNSPLVNGRTDGLVRMRPGEAQRWRFVHAGITSSINLQLVPAPTVAKAGVTMADYLKALDAAGEKHVPLNVIAYDGIATGSIKADDAVLLQPGYRVDVIAQAPTAAGDYLLIDASSTAAASLQGIAENPGVLARVLVEGEPTVMELPTSAELAQYAPYTLIPDAEISACQTVFLNNNAVNNVNYHYATDADTRRMVIGTAEEWVVQGSHPFHIHVNPFYVTSNPNDPDMQGVWKDTIMGGNSLVTLRTRYEDFQGQFVLHCHILNHEDAGMMQLVDVGNRATGSTGHPGTCAGVTFSKSGNTGTFTFPSK